MDHQRAMQCRELEDWLEYALSLLETIRRIDGRLRQRVADGVAPFDPAAAEDVFRLSKLWFAPAESLLREIERFEGEGFAVENAARFRAECRRGFIPGVTADDAWEGAGQVQRGETMPLGEILDAIRRRTLH